MMSIAIAVLWFLIGLIILCGIIYLAIWVIEQFVTPIPEKIKQGVWVIVLLLALIALITVLAGGGLGSMKAPFRVSGVTSGTATAVSAAPSRHMQELLRGGLYATSQ